MDTKTMIIQGSIMLVMIAGLSFFLDGFDEAAHSLISAETQSIETGNVVENFVACPMSQGMLIGKQPFFMYQNGATSEQGQLQAVKVAAGIINSKPICKYYNNQSHSMFSIILPGQFPNEQCRVENSDRVGFICTS